VLDDTLSKFHVGVFWESDLYFWKLSDRKGSSMDIPELMNMLQATIGSAVMISSSALLCLIIQTRYGRVVDRIRKLIYEQRSLQQEKESERSNRGSEIDLTQERLKTIDVQIELLLKRGSKLRWALSLTFSAVFSFVFTSFLIMIGSLVHQAMVISLVAVTFFFGMFFLLLGAITTVNEIANSYDAIMKEVKFARFEASEAEVLHKRLKSQA
jgi:ABC-type multidrug transport system fused ATPase/permease subunit